MSAEVVVLVPTGMGGALRDLALEACARADVRACVWDAESTPATPSPALVVAGLPAGDRHIAPGVADLVTRVFAGTPLLLLCNEPIVRPTITLQRGRVALLGEPLTVERVSSRIRTTLSGVQTTPLGEAKAQAPGTPRVKEFRGREWWAGVVARAEAPEPDPLPLFARLGRQGCLTLLPLDPRQRDAAARVLDLARENGAHAPLESALAARVSELAAALWYIPSSQRWAWTCPPGVRCWLYSPVRLPTRWPLSRATAAAPAWQQLAAGSGDMVLLWAGAAAEQLDHDAVDGVLWRAAEGGGPALLDHLETAAGVPGDWSAAVVVELR